MSKHFRWQVVITLLGIALLGSLLAYLTFTFVTVIVPGAGGTYVEGLAGDPQYINPILCQYNQVDRDLCSLIFNGLTRLDEKGKVVSDLAEGWELSDDGLAYTFHLRRDVFWHDEVSFSADDVVFTVQAMQDPDYRGASYLAELWRSVEAVKVDSHTVKFILKEPFAPFLHYTTIGILPAHLLADIPAESLPSDPFNRHPIGTGLFKVEEVNAEHALLEANPLFYDSKPYLNKIEFRFYLDYESILRAYEQGEVQGISRVLPKDLPEAVEANSELQLFSARLPGYTLIFLNLEDPELPFFQEKLVRQALLYAIDRQELVDQVLEGQGLVAHSPILPETWAYANGIAEYEHSRERAEDLLNEAGWLTSTGEGNESVREKAEVKLAFTLLTDDDPLHVKLAREIARQWEAIGVKATLRTVGSGLVRERLVPRKFEALLIDLELHGDPDPYPLWHSTQATSEGQNYAGFVNYEADTLLEEARCTDDSGRRAELYRRFQDIFADEVPSLLLYYPIYTYAVDEKVKGVQLGPMGDPSDRFRNVAEWYIVTKRVIVGQADR
ncbi:MAG: peptide ABC transporter substrate-binding protein [Anaerolineales bacterium]|nr:peptide ABC transporter substrate-binding protein [Anaerolineales bacterium]